MEQSFSSGALEARRLDDIWSENKTLAWQAAAAGGGGGLCRRLPGWDGSAGLGGEFSGFGVDGLEGDLVAEAFQAADVAAGLALGPGALVVVAGVELAVVRFGVAQQGAGDDELGSRDGALGFLPGHMP